MARPLRIEFPGAFYHVTSRGNERKPVYVSRRDREKFLEYLESATLRYAARIHVYCLMTNHYHLLVETPEGNLSQIMRHLNGAYTTYFKTKRQRSGHLFQGRYKAILVERDEHLVELSRYVHLNPVRAGMVEQPDQHGWSSFGAYVGKAPTPPWLEREEVLARFGKTESEAMARYRQFVEDQVGKQVESPWVRVVGSTVLGSTGFVEWVQKEFLSCRPTDREVPAARAFADRPSLNAIAEAVKGAFSDDEWLARKMALYLCHRYSGRPLREIGARFGLGPSGVSEASRAGSKLLAAPPGVKQRLGEVSRGLGIAGV